MQAFHLMVPLVFNVPSTLCDQIGLGSHCNAKFALDRRSMSMKFPVAPQLMRAVVSTICVPVASMIGRRMVHSFGKATSTWDKSWEEDVEATSNIKNPLHQRRWWWWPHSLHHPQSKSSGFGGYPQASFP